MRLLVFVKTPFRVAVAAVAVGLVCLLGLLQPIHVCTESSGRAGSPCAVCVLGHSTAPAPAPVLLPQPAAAEPVAVLPDFSPRTVPVFEQLFIRPPPSA